MSREQASTTPTTIEAIMRSPYFAFGVNDARAGRPFRADYEKWDGNDQWNYERGRQWAMRPPRHVALKRRGELNPIAVLYTKHIL
jgi:hypothetical protein